MTRIATHGCSRRSAAGAPVGTAGEAWRVGVQLLVVLAGAGRGSGSPLLGHRAKHHRDRVPGHEAQELLPARSVRRTIGGQGLQQGHRVAAPPVAHRLDVGVLVGVEGGGDGHPAGEVAQRVHCVPAGADDRLGAVPAAVQNTPATWGNIISMPLNELLGRGRSPGRSTRDRAGAAAPGGALRTGRRRGSPRRVGARRARGDRRRRADGVSFGTISPAHHGSARNDLMRAAI